MRHSVEDIVVALFVFTTVMYVSVSVCGAARQAPALDSASRLAGRRGRVVISRVDEADLWPAFNVGSRASLDHRRQRYEPDSQRRAYHVQFQDHRLQRLRYPYRRWRLSNAASTCITSSFTEFTSTTASLPDLRWFEAIGHISGKEE
ncbi:unnamed protein product [Sphagnum balticum]